MRFGEFEKRLRTWMERHADGVPAQILLGVVSFIEASFFILPPSTLMVSMIVLSMHRRWLYLALFTTVTSVLGGLFGYLIGSVLYDSIGVFIVERYHLGDTLTRVGELFANNAGLAVFIGAFTPIPYKAFTIGAGFFAIDIIVFTVASFVGRGIRFFILAYLAHLFGEHIARRVFGFITLITVGALIAIIGLIIWEIF